MEKFNRNDISDRFKQYEITKEEIDEKANIVVMTVRPSMDYEIKSLRNVSGGNIAYSMWEGYKENSSTERFLSSLSKRGMTLKTIHTSGHADYQTQQRLLAAVQPKELIPIHTLAADQYQEAFPESSVKLVHNGEIIGDEQNSTSEPKELTLFEHLEEIGTAHEKNGSLDGPGFKQFIEKVHSHVDFVCSKLDISEIQAVLFSDLINLMDGFSISIKDMTDFIGCKTVKLIKHIDEFKVLEEKELISIITSDREGFSGKISFEIGTETLDTIQKGMSPISDIGKELSLDDFFTRLAQICENRVQKKVKHQRTIITVQNLLKNNNHLGLVKTLKSYGLSTDDELILLRFCHYFVDLEKEEMDFEHLEALYNNVSDFRTAKQQLKNGTHPLLEKGLIQNVNSDGFGAADVFCLTDKAKDELLSEIEAQFNKKPMKGLKAASEIAVKKLFYPEKTAGQVEELTKLLREENFTLTQKRLSDEGMRTGFACLFSGGPGTGKTETVYQIARETGRSIMQVDIANTKSMWFGESEKKN
jgi:hypothetical protein